MSEQVETPRPRGFAAAKDSGRLLCDWLFGTAWEVKHRLALRALSDGNPEKHAALEMVSDGLRFDNEPEARFQHTLGDAMREYPEIQDILLSGLSRDPDPERRIAAAYGAAIASIDDERIREILGELSADPIDSVREAAQEAQESFEQSLRYYAAPSGRLGPEVVN